MMGWTVLNFIKFIIYCLKYYISNRMFKKKQKTTTEQLNNINVQIKPSENQESPRFGPPKINQQIKQQQPSINTVGKVGKSQHQYLKIINQTAKSNKQRKVSKQQLKQHNTETSAWVSLNGVVYDVTTYLKYHPGGKKQLLRGAGIDCTHLFNQYHPWVNGKYLLQKFKVGYLSTTNDFLSI